MKFVVFDLDNCLADDSWRRPFIGSANFHQMCEADPCPSDRLALVRRHAAARHRIVILTSRPEQVRLQTQEWLAQHGIWADRVLMRPRGDSRSSVLLKPGLLLASGIEVDDIVAVYDDRQDVLDALRNIGVRNTYRLAIREGMPA